jgi:hypothetical protein
MRKITALLISVAMVASLFAFAAPAMAADNLITNGGFEAGNTGFTTEYTYLDPSVTGGWTLGPPFMFTIGTNPGLYHSAWMPGFGDHTSGAGKMMIVNGTSSEAGAPNKLVWGQNVTLPACEPVVTSYPLFAGQTWQVGVILVTNTAGKICVEYKLFDSVLAAGWRLTETHLAIATSANGIPQTKTGNPIPGQFPYSRSYDPGVSSDKYCIDWSCAPGANIIIAAHAVVNKPSTSHLEYGSFCVASGANTKLGDAVTPATLCWVHPLWNSSLRDAATDAPSDLSTYASWVWDTLYNPAPRNGDLVDLYHEFQLPDGAAITSGELQIAADNAFSWKLNGGAFTDVNLAGDWRSQSVFSWPTYVIDPNMSGWKKVYTYDVKSQLSPLANALYVTGVNAAWDTDDPTVNPAGVLYKLCGTWEKEVSDNNSANDTAWGGTENFKGKNWAKYMTYTCQRCPAPVYKLEFYAASSYPEAPAQLEVRINGVVVPPTLELTSTKGEWVKYSATWNAGSATSALIEIRDLRYTYSGDDFCIDDISFVKQ